MSILIGFLPWILFGYIAHNNYQLAAEVALVSSLIIYFPDMSRGKIKVFEAGTLIYFAVLILITFIPGFVKLELWTRPASTVSLFLISLVSIIIKKPFSLQYAYEEVEEKYWKTPKFIAVNYIISWAWCVGFALMSMSSYISLEWVDQEKLFNSYIPLAITAVLILFTKAYPNYVTAVETKRHQADN
ncbi:MAG: hypothetical protein AB1782_05685 [Cyanobacteriota bacterium]